MPGAYCILPKLDSTSHFKRAQPVNMQACGTTLDLLRQVIAANHVGNGILVLNIKPFDHPHGEAVFSRQELGLSFGEAIWPSPYLIYARGIPTLQLNTLSPFAGKLRKPSLLKEP